VDGVLLGKPKDREDAKNMLTSLSGRRHRVVSGVCLWRTGHSRAPLTGHAESWLVMPPLEEDFICQYLDSGLWQGKAGACGFQDGHIPLELVSGSATNVVGLPVELVRDMLRQPPKNTTTRTAF
jgi:septum formation protein